MIITDIRETDLAFLVECHPVCKSKLFDVRQEGNWIQIDKQQAAQLIAVLQKWIDGEEVE